MNLNRSSFFLLRQLNPETAAGRDALQQLTQQDVDTIRATRRKVSPTTESGARAVATFTKVCLAITFSIVFFGLIVSLGMHLEPGPLGPVIPKPVEYLFAWELTSIWPSTAILVTAHLVCKWLINDAEIGWLFKPMEEHRLVERALRVAREHERATSYLREVTSRRELISADADALIQIAAGCRREAVRTSQQEKLVAHQQTIRHTIEELQGYTTKPD